MGTSGWHSGALHELAREIEDTQRRQSDMLSNIVGRLRALGSARAEDGAAAEPAEQPHYESDAYWNDESQAASQPESGREPERAPDRQPHQERGDDEPWDVASAEALMQTYETGGTSHHLAEHFGAQAGAGSHDWLGSHFNDVTRRLKRTLADLKPGSTMALLEERLEQFQKHISSALEDVVRRSDLQGLRLIEAHVNDLDDKLIQIERHVARLDGIEADVRSVMDQVSDERIAKLLDYDSRFAADLEAVAMRAAEEMHSRLGQGGGYEADAQRYQELRDLIEASIQDRRQAAAEASSLVADLSGRVTEQSDRYDEIKRLLELAITEQRQNEQTAVGMLDTLQQAMVRILDRLDAVEQQQAVQPSAFAKDYSEPSYDAYAPAAATAPFGATAAPAQEAPESDLYANYPPPREPEAHPRVEVPAAFENADGPDVAGQDDSGPTIERLRRDFIADARRAKMKAAANRAEAISHNAEPPRRGMEQAKAVFTRLPLPTGSSRLFGASPKVLAGALALIVAINGGLLLMNRKDSAPPPPPEITLPEDGRGGAATGAGSGEEGDHLKSAPIVGPRSHLDTDLDDMTAGTEPVVAPLVTPYGVMDDVLNPPAVEAGDSTEPAAAPRGTTLARPIGSLPDDVVADVYQQQMLAGLSDQLGTIVADKTTDALLPETNGRIDTAYSDQAAVAPEAGSERESGLDLPPATVGPLSLRLAAANGDASAEFEVAARLAEGKGTNQNYAEALRWYQRSAAKGFAQSQYRLGTLYERGLGVEKDLARARIWYARAAEQGNVKSMHNLAVLAAGGEHGEPDYAAASQWFGKAAEYGLADSQYNLGVLAENGLGITLDRVAAYKWYALAAKSGDADAQSQRDALKAKLSADELAQAEKLVAEFKARSMTRLANDARAAGEDWKTRARNDGNG